LTQGTVASEHESGGIGRRVFCERLIGVVGTCAAASQFLTSAHAMSSPPHWESDGADVESGTVKYPGEGVTLQGYLSRPRGIGPFPAVIVIHANLGLDERTREATRRAASQGCVALAVDLLSRQGGTASFATRDHVSRAFQNIRDNDVVRDLNASYRYLNSRASVERDAIAVLDLSHGNRFRQDQILSERR
jgi:carboxymethylenebutenolidase